MQSDVVKKFRKKLKDDIEKYNSYYAPKSYSLYEAHKTKNEYAQEILCKFNELLQESGYKEEPELKPCPCCGGEPQIYNCADYSAIFCSLCGLKMITDYFLPSGERDAALVKKWNARV